MPFEHEIIEGQTEPVPNDHYANGNERTMYEYLVVMNPYAQANYEFEPMYDRYVEYERSKMVESPLIKIFFCSAAESGILIFAGLLAFKRKELK